MLPIRLHSTQLPVLQILPYHTVLPSCQSVIVPIPLSSVLANVMDIVLVPKVRENVACCCGRILSQDM